MSAQQDTVCKRKQIPNFFPEVEVEYVCLLCLQENKSEIFILHMICLKKLKKTALVTEECSIYKVCQEFTAGSDSIKLAYILNVVLIT